MKIKASLICLFLLVSLQTLTACGQKGPLYFPETDPAQETEAKRTEMEKEDPAEQQQ